MDALLWTCRRCKKTLPQSVEERLAGLTIEELTKAQGVEPTADLRTIGTAWPEDEDLDQFLVGVYERRPLPIIQSVVGIHERRK